MGIVIKREASDRVRVHQGWILNNTSGN